MGVVLTGDKALEKAFANLDKAIQGKSTRKAVRAGTKVLADATKANVPVGPGNKHHKGGLWKKNITVRAMKRKRGRIGARVTIKNSEQFVTINKGVRDAEPGKRHFYPAVIEYGDATHKPQAPMRRAFDANKFQAVDAMKSTLATEVYANAK